MQLNGKDAAQLLQFGEIRVSNASTKPTTNLSKIEQLLGELVQQSKTHNLDKRLWSVEDIAAYLNLSKSSVYSRVVCKRTFPHAVRIPVGESRANRRWYPGEIKEWVATHREGKPTLSAGRPRQIH